MILKSQITNHKSQINSKSQLPNLKNKNSFGHWIFGYWILFGICNLLFGIFPLYAKEITILYTGETHAMLYPCNCPKEPDGGVGRRAALVREIREKNPDTLLLDSGGFFSGGLMDEYTQNTELDMQRTMINLKAMKLMKYDAVAIGDDEFNFGRNFLDENIRKINLPFLSCNLDSREKFQSIRPYLIKEIAGTKIGIIGVTPPSTVQKVIGLKIIEPKIAVKQAIEEVKKQGANIIILLSHLEEGENIGLIKEIRGIDIVIMGHNQTNGKEPFNKIDSTLVLRSVWQGRKLGKLSLIIKDNKIVDYKVDQIRLSDKISDDQEMFSILPRCFSDNNCKNKNLIGKCQDAGGLSSRCVFDKPSKISLLVIMPRPCVICDTERPINFLKTQLPGLVVSYLYYPDSKADKLIKEFGVKGLPIYLLGKEAEKEKNFDGLKENLEMKGDFYMLKPQFTGFSYFLNRQNLKGNLDLFISLYGNNTVGLLDVIREFNPSIHFLVVEQQDKFDAAGGNAEIEECLRSVCVQKHYPQIFWNYITCRAKNVNSSWWEDCLPAGEAGLPTGQAGLDKFNPAEVSNCARGQEGKVLLKDNISLNKELGIMFGPAYLVDNQEVFGSQGVPTKEELKKIIRRR